MKRLTFCIIVCGLISLFPATSWAQRMITVQGRVLNQGDKKPFGNDVEVSILAFNTVAAARDAEQTMTNNPGSFITPDMMSSPDRMGDYEVQVADNGAILFVVEQGTPHVEMVDGRHEINVLLDAGIILDDVVVEAEALEITATPKAPKLFGNKLAMTNTFSVPKNFGRNNARLIIQPVVFDCQTEDTLFYCNPVIMDGSEYGVTQNRRKNFNYRKLDPLMDYVVDSKLTEDQVVYPWNDTITVPDVNKSYHALAVYRLEDYNEIYYNRELQIVSCEMKHPFRFLEFKFGQRNLDPQKFYERPKREKRSTAGSMQLTFLLGKAELDPENAANDSLLNQLKQDLTNLVNDPDATLKDFELTAVSSPEGGYQSNLALSQRRVQYAKDVITSVIPKTMLDRMRVAPDAIVADWKEVATLLRDSLPDTADVIEDIVNRTSNRDTQYQQIARLPEYKTSIMSVLPHLRTIKFKYQHELFRELSPEEILDKYQHDPDFRSGKKQFALYEYWHLFRMVKDKKELEALYKRAYDDSMKAMGEPWALAANNLAVSYLQRDTFDLKILEPLIDRHVRNVNVKRKALSGREQVINYEEIVANQLAMAIRANSYEDASIMAQILPPTPENEEIIAFAMCMGGYFEGKANRKYFNRVAESSPMNKVVMNMALESKSANRIAEETLKQLPPNDATTLYIKAQLEARKGDLGMMGCMDALKRCFQKDEKFMGLALTDGEFVKEDVEQTIKDYQEEKELMNSFSQQ